MGPGDLREPSAMHPVPTANEVAGGAQLTWSYFNPADHTYTTHLLGLIAYVITG